MMFDSFSSGEGTRGGQRSQRTQDGEVLELRQEIERLLLVTEALWKIVREKCNCDEKDLVRVITEIDLQDGQYDLKKKATAPRPCPKCGRTLAKRKAKCLFCGEPIAFDPFER